MNGIGTRLPITAVNKAILMSSPAITPAGIAARSSSTGTIEIKNVISILPKVVPSSASILCPLFRLIPFQKCARTGAHFHFSF